MKRLDKIIEEMIEEELAAEILGEDVDAFICDKCKTLNFLWINEGDKIRITTNNCPHYTWIVREITSGEDENALYEIEIGEKGVKIYLYEAEKTPMNAPILIEEFWNMTMEEAVKYAKTGEIPERFKKKKGGRKSGRGR